MNDVTGDPRFEEGVLCAERPARFDKLKHKAYVYLTSGRELLVFRQPDQPYVGLQVPGGTVDPGESHLTAALREFGEETGLALRGTFVINPEGKLVSSQVNFYNVGRNMEELVRIMEANAHCTANPDEACPAKWAPGAKTLTPSEGMVGNVYEALND